MQISMSTILHLGTAEQFYGFEFKPKIEEVLGNGRLRLIDSSFGVDVYMSIRQLEILKATIGAFLEAEAEKNKAAAAVIDETVQESVNAL